MPDFEKQYDRFQVTAEKCDSLRRLADSGLLLPRATDRVVFETVIVEDGERRIVKREEKGAKLV